MRLLLIVNATASSVTARRRVVIQKALGSDHDLAVAETSRRGHATHLAAAAARDGYDVVVVLAGDGTLNEAADGLARTPTALAPLPGGSTNVFARSLGVAFDPIEATGQLLSSLDHRSFRRIGLGAADGRRFLFHLGLGYDAAVIRQVERRAYLKRHLAHPAFVVAACATWLRHYDRHTRLRVEVPADDGTATLIGEGPFAIVSNAGPYTYLGRRPITVAPRAGLGRPLALTLFRTLRLPLVLAAAASGLSQARLIMRSANIIQRHDLARIRVVGDRPFPWQVDGDHLGDIDRLDVTYERDALTLVVP